MSKKALFARYKWAFHSWLYYAVFLLLAGGTIVYFETAMNAFSAFVQYRQFTGIWDLQHATDDAVRHDEALQAIQSAIERNPNQVLYAAEQGKYLLEHNMAGTLPPLSTSLSQEPSLTQAEDLLKHAISRDPANPWYYYDLGRLSYHRGDCEKSMSQAVVPCPTLRQYQRALSNYPNNLFLRQEIGQWWLTYDPDGARRSIRQLVSQDLEEPLLKSAAPQAKQFAKFLYRLPMDYESEQERTLALRAEGKDTEACDQTTLVTQTAQAHEFGNDDGSADWNVPLTSPDQRIRKIVCLPNDLSHYRAASLKIMMNSVGQTSVRPLIFVDDLELSGPTLQPGFTPRWHDIPFELHALEGKSSVHVYIRISGIADTHHTLLFWGDQQPTTPHSVFNFDKTNDLSPAAGTQTGEYLIRLVLYP